MQSCTASECSSPTCSSRDAGLKRRTFFFVIKSALPCGGCSLVFKGTLRVGLKPEPAALGLFMGYLEPLASPDPLDPLVVDDPASLLEQPGDLAIAVAAVLPCKLDDVGGEPLFVFTAPRCLALCRAVLPERRTGAALGDMRSMVPLTEARAA